MSNVIRPFAKKLCTRCGGTAMHVADLDTLEMTDCEPCGGTGVMPPCMMNEYRLGRTCFSEAGFIQYCVDLLRSRDIGAPDSEISYFHAQYNCNQRPQLRTVPRESET